MASAPPFVSTRRSRSTPIASAKAAVAAAKNGAVVVRLVAGDPYTSDAAVKEVLAVGRTSVPFDVVPGVATATAVPAFAGGFINFGYWTALPGPGDRQLTRADRVRSEEDLYRLVLGTFDLPRGGTALDVGCGRGPGQTHTNTNRGHQTGDHPGDQP